MSLTEKQIQFASKLWKQDFHVDDIATSVECEKKFIYAATKHRRVLFPARDRRRKRRLSRPEGLPTPPKYHCRYFDGRTGLECGKPILSGTYFPDCMPLTLPFLKSSAA